ncbi:MAG: 50S ribosomal protein L11 methyltransferase, partial [Oscillospiraceae bacterium]
KKYYHPTKIGNKIVICPSWEDYNQKDGEVVVRLDPGMAFGTGTHDTTRLCMTLLEKYINNQVSVLDIGTGSGILAITAKLLGAVDVCGCDIDKLATTIAGENAKMNGVKNSIEFYCGNLLEHCTKKYDVVCANIVADIILDLIPNVHNALKEDGIFIISGIIEMRTDDIFTALDEYGYDVVEQIDNGGWFAFACKKR